MKQLRHHIKQYSAYVITVVVAGTAFGAVFLQTRAALVAPPHPISMPVAPAVSEFSAASISPTVSAPDEPVTRHQEIPHSVKGIYISGWVAGTERTMDRIVTLLDTTSANAVIIDIKDATGRLSYMPLDPDLVVIGVGTNRIKHLDALINRLHDRDIYVIGRVAVFQDPYFALVRPETAFKDTRTGMNWHDNKGLAWLRTDDERVWEYTVDIARDAYAQGFDEINLDYVRFPSDGPLAYVDKTGLTKSRPEVVRDFFAYMDTKIRTESGIPLSADIFGLAMSATGDLGIGQILEYIAPHVDYVAPMVYPSHFAPGTYGIQDPSSSPYDIIHRSMTDGVKKMVASGQDPLKLRPWLQDFDLGATYTADMVRAQINATEAVGLTSWMMWDPRNVYTKGAF